LAKIGIILIKTIEIIIKGIESVGFSKTLQGILVKALDRPFGEGSGTDGTVDRKGRFIPVETDPFHPAATTFYGNLGKVLQEGFAITPAPFLGKDKQVLEVQALPPDECGEVMEEQRESRNLPVLLAEKALGGTLNEKGMIDGGLIRNDIILTFLIDGELVDQVQDDTGFVRFGRMYGE
jgi:hypothetical protein